MKSMLHATTGVLGFSMAVASLLATVVALGLGDSDTIVTVKRFIFYGTLLLAVVLAGTGATGMSMLGARTEPLALTKQQRGPIGFMTTTFLLVPSAWFLSSWAAGPWMRGLLAYRRWSSSLRPSLRSWSARTFAMD